MKEIKIKKELWDLIVSGEKKFEFRKLSKGITTGIYLFVDVEQEIITDKKTGKKYTQLKKFGTAYLEPIGVESITSGFIRTSRKNLQIDISSYNFIKEHYEGKYDFVCYEISNVKEI